MTRSHRAHLLLELVAGAGKGGVGKSTIAQNLAHQAAIQGHTVLFTSAASMLNDLAGQDGDMALKRRLKYYAQPKLLVIDEVGYLSYSNRHADLLFEIVSRRYEQVSTIVTTNRPFSEWCRSRHFCEFSPRRHCGWKMPVRCRA